MTTSSVSRPPVSIQYIYIYTLSLLSMCVCAGYYYRVILRARSYRLLMCLMVAHISKGVDCKSRTGWYRNERHLLPLFHLSCTHTHTYIHTGGGFSLLFLSTPGARTHKHIPMCAHIFPSPCACLLSSPIFSSILPCPDMNLFCVCLTLPVVAFFVTALSP